LFATPATALTDQDGNGIFGFTLDSKKEIVLIQDTPILVPKVKDVVSIAAGGDFVLALDKSGDVYGWGNGQQDQLGRRLLERRRKEALLPTRIALPRKSVTAMFAATNHAFAIDKDGEVWAWGLNNFAQTGIAFHAGDDGGTVTAPTKVDAFTGRDVKMLAGGSHHSLAVTGAGECLAWGRMDGDQIGIDIAKLPTDDEDKVVVDERERPRILLEPTAIPGIECAYVDAASDTSLAITKEGKAYSWGFNANYQCGQGTDDDVKVATMVDNTAVREKKLVWAGAGGQYSMFAAYASEE
jgi:regulator of chromosome condensation